MAAIVYLLCTLTSGLCAVLLLRVYRRHSWGTGSAPPSLLLWSGLSFGVMAVNNALVLIDLVLLPSIDLALYRGASFFLATVLLLYGLVWDND